MPVIVWLSLLTCLAMFAMLGVYTYQQQPAAIAALVHHRRRVIRRRMGLSRWTGRTIKEPA